MVKQLKIISFFLLIVTTFSCDSSDNKNEKVTQSKRISELEKKDSTNSIEDEVDTTVKVKELVYIEDYANLKTYDQALEYFKEENMKVDTSWYAEGTVMMFSHECTDPNNGNIIELVWKKGGAEKLAHVEAFYQTWEADFSLVQQQPVKTKCGLHTGMTLNQLEAFCGKPVQFFGFGWDYGGGVMMNGNSKLEECGVNIILEMDQSNYDQSGHLLGDIELKSNDENVKHQAQSIFIQKITYYLN